MKKTGLGYPTFTIGLLRKGSIFLVILEFKSAFGQEQLSVEAGQSFGQKTWVDDANGLSAGIAA
jgi:hypothetical protein